MIYFDKLFVVSHFSLLGLAIVKSAYLFIHLFMYWYFHTKTITTYFFSNLFSELVSGDDVKPSLALSK